MWPYSRPQGLSPESTTFSAEHLIESSCNRQKANEIFHNLSSCNTRRSLFQGQFYINGNLCSLWRMTIYTTVYTPKLTLASQMLLNSCAQILNIWDPEYQKKSFYQRVKRYPYGILLLPWTSNTLKIFRISKVTRIWIYIQQSWKEIFWMEKEK